MITQWWYSVFLFPIGNILFGKFVPKNQNCGSWNIEPRLIRICRIRWWFLWFSFVGWKYPFWANLVQKFQIVSSGWNLQPRLLQINKIREWCHFFVLDLFLQVFLKKIIWHFHVKWLISQQFTRIDLKSVAFHVVYKTILQKNSP